VLVTHGFADAFSRFLCERGIEASVLPTRFVGEGAPDDAAEADADAAEPTEADTDDDARPD
jgi:hypothetical protein